MFLMSSVKFFEGSIFLGLLRWWNWLCKLLPWAFCICAAYLMTFLSNFFLFSHDKKNGNFCCGSNVYDHHKQFMKCCSGHLYNLTDYKGKPECCGNLLLINKTNQICCFSSTHAILYDTKPNHHCCGHYHYNTSLWSCCAEHLKPTPSPNSSQAEDGLKPLMDLIPDICNKTGDVL